MSSTSLKVLALILMLIDHIAEFIPGIPVWFHWLGRLSAPLFMFCMVWGFYYTHDRKKYILRMYLFGVLMAVMDLICNNAYKNPYIYITNNIFVTLLMVALIVGIIEERKKDKKKGNKYLLYFILAQIVSTVICILLGNLIPLKGVALFIGALSANLIFNEGSFIFTFLGVLLYFNKEDKRKLSIAYGLFCLVYFGITCIGGIDFNTLFYFAYQWMMIGSLPLILLYNGQKGRGLKYLFYVFYPVHILVLYWVGNLCFPH